MKYLLALVCVLGWACAAHAEWSLLGAPTEPIQVGETVTLTVHNTEGGAYSGWLELTTPAVADFAGAPEFTGAGNPGGTSQMTYWPDFGAWYEFSVSSFPPNPAIGPGDHILINVAGLSVGSAQLNLYASDSVTLLDACTISVIPEPATLVLLGLGGLLLRRRR